MQMQIEKNIRALQIQVAIQGFMIDQLSLLISQWLSPEQLSELRVIAETVGSAMDQECELDFACKESLQQWTDQMGRVHVDSMKVDA